MEMTRQQAIDLDHDIKWKALRSELDKIIDTEHEKLLFSENPEEIVRLQERVKALRFVTRFPSIIAEREEDLIETPDNKIIT